MALAMISGFIGALDVKCCAMRDRSDFDAHMMCVRRPTSKPQVEPSTLNMHHDKEKAYHYGQENHRHRFKAEVDGHIHSTNRCPVEVVDKIAKLTDKNPYIAREIGERSSGSLRFRFLKQCMSRRYDQCDRIWGNLDEKDRLDFLQVLRLGNKTPECFFLNIMMPDERTWNEEISEYSYSDTRSDSGSDYPLRRGGCSASSNSSDTSTSTRCSEAGYH